MIRKARKSDFDQIFKLTMMASKLVLEDALGTTDEKAIKDMAFNYFNDDNTKYSCKNIYVYETASGVAGCLIYYDSTNEKLYNNVMESYLDNDYKYTIEALEYTMYLDTVAVFEEHRGQGIARTLIEYMIDSENKDISLIAENHKNYVIEFYQKLGFKAVKTTTMYNSIITLMVLENK